jgi:N-acetylglutamate synthase-like GNAT family acetyltransferase/ADP-ribose pyrophosphatase YjhB (NUDIX family)
VEIRTAKEHELERLAEFDRNYAGSHATIDGFRERFEKYPETFIIATEDGEIIGDATGKMEGENCMGLQSIAVKEGYKGQGIGTEILRFFEEKAEKYADKVTVASADNVEEFYQKNGYEPVQIMLQVNKEDLPENYRQREEIVDERHVDQDTTFLYANFDEYSRELRDSLKHSFNAFEVNTIYEKKLDLAELSEYRVDELIEELQEKHGDFELNEKTWEVSEEGLSTETQNFRQGGYGGAGIWLTNQNGEVLLVKNEGDEEWGDPGGHHENRESFEAAAKRETKEEANVEAEITGIQSVEKVKLQHQQDGERYMYNLLVIFRGEYHSGEPKPQKGEIKEVEWWDKHPEKLLYEDLEQFAVPATDE